MLVALVVCGACGVWLVRGAADSRTQVVVSKLALEYQTLGGGATASTSTALAISRAAAKATGRYTTPAKRAEHLKYEQRYEKRIQHKYTTAGLKQNVLLGKYFRHQVLQ